MTAATEFSSNMGRPATSNLALPSGIDTSRATPDTFMTILPALNHSESNLIQVFARELSVDTVEPNSLLLKSRSTVCRALPKSAAMLHSSVLATSPYLNSRARIQCASAYDRSPAALPDASIILETEIPG